MNYIEIGQKIKEILDTGYDELTTTHPTVADLHSEYISCTENGELTMSYPIRKSQCNGHNVMQGGVITEAFDNNFGIFTFVLFGGEPATSIDITTNFHKAITMEDKKIYIKSRVINRGKRIIHMGAEAFNAQNTLIATCYTNIIILGSKKKTNDISK